MRQRAIILALCLCITGTSAFPASWLPCCCKSKRGVAYGYESQSSCPSCSVGHIKQDLVKKQSPCCTGSDSHCSSSSLGSICLTCRCHEQMRLVGVSQSADSQVHAKFETLSSSNPIISPASEDASCRLPRIALDDGKPIKDISLSTCTLRF